MFGRKGIPLSPLPPPKKTKHGLSYVILFWSDCMWMGGWQEVCQLLVEGISPMKKPSMCLIFMILFCLPNCMWCHKEFLQLSHNATNYHVIFFMDILYATLNTVKFVESRLVSQSCLFHCILSQQSADSALYKA